jgi:hypothetical protein
LLKITKSETILEEDTLQIGYLKIDEIADSRKINLKTAAVKVKFNLIIICELFLI